MISTQPPQTRRALLAGVSFALVGLGVTLGTALADRSPTAPPVVYSGQILMGGTAVADGSHMVGLSLWSTPSGATGGLCDMPAASVTTSAGQFSLLLSADCATAFETEEEVHVQIIVDGTTLARTRAGAVPYAVTAERVVSRGSTGDGITDGLFRNVSATAFTGAVSFEGATGYPAARNACVAAVGTSTAHMCTAPELHRSAQLGDAIPSGYFLSSSSFNLSGAGAGAEDCLGLTSASTTQLIHHWNGSHPAVARCSDALPLLCCD